MEEKVMEKNNGGFIRQILRVLRANVWLILAVVIIATACGLGYSYLRNPKYTAKIRVSFSVEGKGSSAIGENMQYINTIVDFADEGVVVDRANAYYIRWVDGYKKNNKTIEDFCKDYLAFGTGIENEIYDNYVAEETLSADRFLYSGSIETFTKQNQQDTNWVFQIGYTDNNEQDAIEKANILALAYEHELEGGEYFIGDKMSVKVIIENLGDDGVTPDMSKTTIVLISFALGIVLALMLVYIKTLFDKTIKDKAELERITEVQIIGCIDLVEEGKNGK